MARRDDRFITLLKQQVTDHAMSSLVSPPDSADRSFEYGRACGVAQGLTLAESLYLGILKEEERKE